MTARADTDARTRVEAVLLSLREMILRGELAPGARVGEAALADRLGVSRTPVRLSLGVLEGEGLVRGEPNRGFTVRRFSLAEVLGAYDVRAVLEGYACRVVAGRGLAAADERALTECVATGDALLARGGFDAGAVREWSAMNGRFHATLITASGNAALASAHAQVNKHPLAAPHSIIFRTGNLDRLFDAMRGAQREHLAVLGALRAGQVMRAEALMTEHVYQSREIVRDELAAAPRVPQASGAGSGVSASIASMRGSSGAHP